MTFPHPSPLEISTMNWDDRLSAATDLADAAAEGLGFSCKVKVLRDAVDAAVDAIEKPGKGRASISSSVMLVALAEGILVVRGSDGRKEICVTPPQDQVVVQEAGAVLVPGHTLRDFLRKLSIEADVSVACKGGDVSLRSGGSRVRLERTGRAQDYQALAAPVSPAVTLDARTLQAACDAVGYAMSSDPARYYLNGIYVHPIPEGDGLRFVATDGHRLSKFDWPCKMEDLPKDCILPRESVDLVDHVTKGAGDDAVVMFRVDRAVAEFAVERVLFRTSLVDGTFPDYARIFPPEDAFTTVVRLPVSRLTQSVGRVQAVNDDRHPSVDIRLGEDGSFRLSAKAAGGVGHEADEWVEVDTHEGGDGTVYTFNARYMTEYLKSVPSDSTVVIRMGGDSYPTSWRQEGLEARDYLLMPVRG
jgi:DNA polymerase-3 subunit beta